MGYIDFRNNGARALVAVSLLCLAGLGCAGPTIHTQVQGDTTVPGSPQVVPVALTGLPPLSGFNNIDFTQTQEFKDQKAAKDHIQSLKVDFVKLQITSPNTQDFGFLDSLSFYVQASGQPDLLIASKDGISKLGLVAPNPTLQLDIPDAELLPYVTAPSMSIAVKGQGRSPQQDVTLHATVGVRAVLKLF